jgi:hypothetical protein
VPSTRLRVRRPVVAGTAGPHRGRRGPRTRTAARVVFARWFRAAPPSEWPAPAERARPLDGPPRLGVLPQDARLFTIGRRPVTDRAGCSRPLRGARPGHDWAWRPQGENGRVRQSQLGTSVGTVADPVGRPVGLAHGWRPVVSRFPRAAASRAHGARRGPNRPTGPNRETLTPLATANVVFFETAASALNGLLRPSEAVPLRPARGSNRFFGASFPRQSGHTCGRFGQSWRPSHGRSAPEARHYWLSVDNTNRERAPAPTLCNIGGPSGDARPSAPAAGRGRRAKPSLSRGRRRRGAGPRTGARGGAGRASPATPGACHSSIVVTLSQPPPSRSRPRRVGRR